MFNDIFPMMASHAIELDEIADEIVRKIKVNGAENQTFTVNGASFHLTEDDLSYIEERVNRML